MKPRAVLAAGGLCLLLGTIALLASTNRTPRETISLQPSAPPVRIATPTQRPQMGTSAPSPPAVLATPLPAKLRPAVIKQREARLRKLGRLPKAPKPSKGKGGAHVANYIVSGAGEPAYNGTYVQTGTNDGKPYYQKSGPSYLYWSTANNRWELGLSLGGTAAYTNVGTGSTPPLTGWATGSAPPSAPTLSVGDTTKPSFLSAAVPSDGLSLVVTLTEADSPPLLPATAVTGFVVKVNGVTRGIDSAARTGASNPDYKKFTLVLSSPVYPGDTVTVAYTPGNVEDSSGNVLDAFTAQSVTNNSQHIPAQAAQPDGLYHLYTGGEHKLRITAPALSGGATSLTLKIYRVTGNPAGGVPIQGDGGLAFQQTGVTAGQVVTSSALLTGSIVGFSAVDTHFWVYWHAVNAYGEAGALPTQFCFYNDLSGLLEARPDVPPEPDSIVNLDVTYTNTADIDSTGFFRIGLFHFLDFEAGFPGAESVVTLRSIANPVFNRVARRKDNAYGAIYGIPVTPDVPDAPETPPTPTVTALAATTATIGAVDFDAGWDTLTLRYWRVSAPGTVLTAAAADNAPTGLTGLITGQPYLAGFRATDGDGNYSDSGTVAFTPTASGDPSPSAPDTPGEVRITKLTDISCTVVMPAKPTNADTLTLQLDSVDYRTGLDSADNVIITGLVAVEDYIARAIAINAYGATAGDPAPFRTEGEPTPDTVPATPDPLTLYSLTPAEAQLTQPTWASNVTSLKVYRKVTGADDSTLTLIDSTTDPEETIIDATVVNGISYTYKCTASNAEGESGYSTGLVVSLVGDAVVEWVSPAASAAIAGNKRMIARAQFPAGYSASLPMRVFYNAAVVATPRTPITGTATDGQWEFYFDTRELDFNGTVTLSIVARNAEGFDSAPVERSFTVNNSLQSAKSYLSYHLPLALSDRLADLGQRISRARLGNPADVLQTSGSPLYWWQFYIKSPEGSDPVDPTDQDEMADYLLTMQRVQLGETFTVLGAREESGARTRTDETLRLVAVKTPRLQVVNSWDTGDATILKFRQLDEDTIEVVSTDHLWTFTAALGLVEVAQFSDYSVASVTDATLIGTKIYCISSGALKIIDLDQGDDDESVEDDDRTFTEVTLGESKTLVAVERIDSGTALVIYSSGGNASAYRHTEGNARRLWTLAKTVTRAHLRGAVLVLATSDHGIYSGAPTTAPTLVYQHDATVLGFLLNPAGAVQFFDTGHIYQANSLGGVDLVATIASLKSIGQFKGNRSAVRGTAGVNGTSLYQATDAGVYSPTFTIPTATNVTAQERLVSTVTPAQGDPLNGGTAAVEDESLIVGYTTASTAKVSRIQISDLDDSTAYRASSVQPSMWPVQRLPQ